MLRTAEKDWGLALCNSVHLNCLDSLHRHHNASYNEYMSHLHTGILCGYISAPLEYSYCCCCTAEEDRDLALCNSAHLNCLDNLHHHRNASSSEYTNHLHTGILCCYMSAPLEYSLLHLYCQHNLDHHHRASVLECTPPCHCIGIGRYYKCFRSFPHLICLSNHCRRRKQTTLRCMLYFLDTEILRDCRGKCCYSPLHRNGLHNQIHHHIPRFLKCSMGSFYSGIQTTLCMARHLESRYFMLETLNRI